MLSNSRKAFTQASLNLWGWKYVAWEIILISLTVGIYLQNIYLFALTLSILFVLFYSKYTSIFISVFFGIIWSLAPAILLSMSTSTNLYDSIVQLYSSSFSQVISFLIFWISFYFHKSASDFFQDAFEPVVGIFIKKNKIKEPVSKKDVDNKTKLINKNYLNDIDFISNKKINTHSLKLFLEKKGFGLLQVGNDRNSEKRIILNDGGVVKFYNLLETKRWISNYIIKNVCNLSDSLLNVWMQYPDTALRKSVIDHLQVYSTIQNNKFVYLDLLKDNKTTCYLKFKNGIVEIKSGHLNFIEYGYKKASVFEDTIIKRNFNSFSKLKDKLIDKENNLFRKFVEKSVLYKNAESAGGWRGEYQSDESTEETMLSLRTAIGYLTHNYNDPSITKAVFLVDRFSRPGFAEGGTGKSLIISSLGNVINQSSQDGKKYRDNPNTGGRFQFSNVDMNTKNIFIDDLKKDFNIETIFTMVTGDIEIERKNVNKFIIPADERPKIALTTNFPLSVRGTSYSRRIHQVALGDYWNRAINEGSSVKEELGKDLFGVDFNNQDWDEFYAFIILCVQDYLKHGLVAYDFTSEKKP